MGTVTAIVVAAAPSAMVAVYTVDAEPSAHVTATRRAALCTIESPLTVSVTDAPAACATLPTKLVRAIVLGPATKQSRA